MAHFAKIESGVVTNVIVAEQSFVDAQDGTWIQVSYNTYGGVHYGSNWVADGGTAVRKNYPAIGYIYDATADAFHPPRPYPSWTLNSDTFRWEPPTARPTDASKKYVWNEGSTAWIEYSE